MEHQTSQSFWNTKAILPMSIIIAAAMISGSLLYVYGPAGSGPRQSSGVKGAKTKSVVPQKAELPIVWGDMGVRLIETGVIDKEKFEALYESRGRLTEADKKLLFEKNNGKLVMTKENSGLVLNLLWAVGLGTKNSILEKGPIADKRYGGVDRFASTGGFTLSRGDMIDHFSKHSFVALTKEQQSLVEKMAAKIYRPCCDNPTLFPDCNHGMAMLGLLELMAAQGVSEKEMYKAALAANTLWFPGTYENIADSLAAQGKSYSSVDPAVLLGEDYSSASGYQQRLSEFQPTNTQGGSGCSV